MPAAKRVDGGGSVPIEVGEVEVVKKTDRALLVKAITDSDLNGDCKKTWVALSQICDGEVSEESEEGDTGRLCVPRWLAETNGWV